MPHTPAGGPPAPNTELTQAIEVFLSIGLSPRQILQLAGLCREAHDAVDSYGEVRVVFTDRRLKRFQKMFGVVPEK